ncbi:MAG: hypothetical protein ACKO7G_07135 [Gammaproteobacteria bacterium]
MDLSRQAAVGAVSAVLFLGVSLSFGQSIPSPDEATLPNDEVLVNASKSPFSIDAKALRRAAAAFDKDRTLAPEAPLRFRVIDYTPKAESLRICIERDDDVETVAVGADGLLSLPETAFADGARLHANRSEEALALTPEILSPGTALHTRRLGDLRLQCRVVLTLDIHKAPLYIRALMPPVSMVCNSKNFGYYVYTGFQVESAEIRGADAYKAVRGDKSKAISKGGNYAAPLHDRSISDDAIIELK